MCLQMGKGTFSAQAHRERKVIFVASGLGDVLACITGLKKTF